jgi:hypothetical protein
VLNDRLSKNLLFLSNPYLVLWLKHIRRLSFTTTITQAAHIMRLAISMHILADIYPMFVRDGVWSRLHRVHAPL